MRIAILAQFPIHAVPGSGVTALPRGHYATWLPQLSAGFSSYTEFDFHWITLDASLGSPRELTAGNQTFHLLPCASRRRASTLFAADRGSINRVLSSIQPELVHGWGTEDAYAFAAVRSGFPNLISMQGILSHYALHARMHAREYAQAALELYILHAADRVTTESEWGRRVILRRNPWARVDLVEYGVHSRFLELRWEPDPARPAAIFIGSLTTRKGVHDAVAAFRDPRLADRELWIIGDPGPWAEKLRVSSTPNVQWLGRLGPQETAERLARAWCLVLPTRGDTSPNVVKEARVIGLPVITTPAGGQTTYIQNGRAGHLVAPGDIAALRECLASLLSDLDSARELGAADHAEHRRLLDPARTAERFAEIYREMKSES